MFTKNYDDVSDMFPEIFVGSHGEYWYRKAWEILEKHGLNAYENREEEFMVYVRAATLGMLYLDFFKKAVEENTEYDDIVSAFQSKIGRDYTVDFFKSLYAKYSEDNEELDLNLEDYADEENEDFITEYDFVENLLLQFTDMERYEIIECIRKELKDFTNCLALYCTSKNIEEIEINENQNEDEDEGYMDEEERYINSLLSTKDYNSFWESIRKNSDEIHNYLVTGNLSAAYEWWKEGGERIDMYW